MRKLFFTLSLFSLVNFSIAQQNKIAGYYCSNFAVIGFFATQIQLNNDSTFKYQLAGDLYNDIAYGKYKVLKDTLYLFFSPEPIDTTSYIVTDSTGKIFYIPKKHHSVQRASKFLYKKGRLFVISQEGELITKNQNYKGKRKKYYLKKFKNHIWQEW